jgi:CheY-like chemotaxis protein
VADGTILIVDDDADVRALTREILEQAGYRLLEAARGPDALALARAHDGPIHLLLTDVVMPGMSGPELARQLAAGRPDTAVLYMSGQLPDTPGARPWLQKPFSEVDLLAWVRRALER